MSWTASERAEAWVHIIHMVGYLGERGSTLEAYRLLDFLQDDYARNIEALRADLQATITVSDGPVPWPEDRGYSAAYQGGTVSCWSSAHEAADGLARMALSLLVWPLDGLEDADQQRLVCVQLLQERWKAIAIPQAEAAALQERIRRERAKLKLLPTAEPVWTDAFVPIKQLWEGKFETYRAAKKFVDEHRSEIRTRKPSAQRLEVHSGDWFRCIAKQHGDREPTDAQIGKYLADIESRQRAIRENKK